MCYLICRNGLLETDRAGFEENANAIGIFDEEEWTKELKIKEEFSLSQNEERVFFCKLEAHPSHLFGVFHIPIKKKEKQSHDFAVYILKERLIFVEEDRFVSRIASILQRRASKEAYTTNHFLCDFFMELIEDDILYLAGVEREIADMEEMVLSGDQLHFNFHMLGTKKEISRLYCYYCQMMDIGKRLLGQNPGFSAFCDRADRLKQEAQSLREYAMQVQDVYQAEISIHQNDVMKLLTIVTTIFLPLTLVAGWYGMNFYNMPELRFRYGYPVVSAISILIVIVSLWFFKKKKFF